MSAAPFPALKKAVTRLVRAEVAYSMKGSMPPEDMIASQQELDNARANYKYRLERLRMAFYTKEVV